METSTTITNTERQAPTALLAVVQHIHEHGLVVPISITPPTRLASEFQLTVVAASLDSWVASGLDIDDVTVAPRNALIAGEAWERVQYDGRLQPHGIRVQLVAVRRVVQLHAVPAVTA